VPHKGERKRPKKEKVKLAKIGVLLIGPSYGLHAYTALRKKGGSRKKK